MVKLWKSQPKSDTIHDAQLFASGTWPGAMVGMKSQMAIGVPYYHAPPGWTNGNRPNNGNWIDVHIGYVTNTSEQLQRAIRPIGPINADPQKAAALQANLASMLVKGKSQA